MPGAEYTTSETGYHLGAAARGGAVRAPGLRAGEERRGGGKSSGNVAARQARG